MRKGRRGFTLVELLIVILIIGVLAAIAVPNFTCGPTDRTRARSCWADIKTVSGGVEMYRLDKNKPDWVLTIDGFEELKREGYLQSIPTHWNGRVQETMLFMLTDKKTIACPIHGFVGQPMELSPLEYAESNGILDGLDVSRLHRRPVSQRDRDRLDRERMLQTLGGGLVAFAVLFTPTLGFFAMRRAAQSIAPVSATAPAPPVRVAPAMVVVPLDAVKLDGVAFLCEESRCPVCASACDAGDADVVASGRCAVPHHRDCLEYLGACGIYGCGGTRRMIS